MNRAPEQPHPRITRVLPAVPAGTHPVWPKEVPDRQPRLSIWLQGRERLHVWDDRVVVAGGTYLLDREFGVRVMADPRAPLTVEPSMGLALLSPSRRWDLYLPANEADVWPAVFAIHQACRERGIEPIGLADEESAASAWGAPAETQPVPQMPPSRPPVASRSSWEAPEAAWFPVAPVPVADAADELASRYDADAGPVVQFTASEAVLAAIAHLSVLFLPVLLPAAIWLSLRFAAPHVAYQARRAALFQCGTTALALATLGYALATAVAHGFGVAARFGLAAFFAILAVAAGCALLASVRVLRNQDFDLFGVA